MADYKKINPAPVGKDGTKKSIDDIRRALREIYKKLDDLEKNKADA